ncbi:MAG: hypothetical protein QXU09_03110 [Thermoproteota archaeon]
MESSIEKVIKCQFCGQEVSIEEAYTWFGAKVCEDCYIERSSPVRLCNPWAVYSAKHTLKAYGVKAEEVLTEKQRKIYNIVKARGKITLDELLEELKVPKSELESHIAIMRYLELVIEQIEKGKIVITPLKK